MHSNWHQYENTHIHKHTWRPTDTDTIIGILGTVQLKLSWHLYLNTENRRKTPEEIPLFMHSNLHTAH